MLGRPRAVSSVGRAPARQAGGHWFEPSTAHPKDVPMAPQFRFAGPADAAAVAALHADSWRRHYRGAYSDAFLDGDVVDDRLAVWTERLRSADPHRCTILAEDGGLIGFANTFLDSDPEWGALLDNLHVAAGHRRGGIGSRLLALTGEAVAERRPGSGLYLWVL